MAQSLKLPAPVQGSVDLLVIAGEHSGDQHAAVMVRHLLGQKPGLRIAALGGPEMAAAGAQVLHDLTATSVVGFVEVLAHANYFRKLFKETLAWIAEHRPRAVCFVDYPGFNLRLAEALRKQGLSTKGGGSIQLLYYISPQIWAWKAHRRFAMEKTLDALAVIFPFEVACFADTKLPVSFVGHPFLEEHYLAPVAYDPQGPILLLPGSRRQAVRRIFPVMVEAFRRLGPGHRAVVLYPSAEIKAVLESVGRIEGLELRQTGTVVAASAVLTSSGTMSMHCALAGIPGAVVYRTNTLTYWLARLLVKTPYIGIANLLLGQPMYPEYIQHAANPEKLAGVLQAARDDQRVRATTAEYARDLHEKLRQPASGTVSDWVLSYLNRV